MSTKSSNVSASCPTPLGSDAVITQEYDQSLTRAQRRLLRRIYNGRLVPIIVDEKPFLTYKEANRYLLSLQPEAREKAYTEMKNCAVNGTGLQPE